MEGKELLVVPAVGLLGLGFGLYMAYKTLRSDPGPREIRSLSRAIQVGASTFLKREYQVMGLIAIFFALFLALALSVYVAFTFVVGAASSALAGFIGMSIATRANGRTTFAARKGQNQALAVAITAGSVMGMVAVSLGILGISGVYLLFKNLDFAPSPLAVITGYSLGASFVAIFARIGGGIYTKAADIGADLVGKVEVGIPEDDPRNAAVIADQVGDNVGDINGMGADTYQAYVDTTIASLLIGAVAQSSSGAPLGEKGVFFPLFIMAVGVVASALAVLIMRALSGSKMRSQHILIAGMLISGALTLLGIFFLSWLYLHELRPFLAAVVGLATGILIGLNTEYYTSRGPVRFIAHSTTTGSATTIITGLAVGLESAVIPMILLGLGMIAAYRLEGMYGIALSGVGMLSILGTILSLDAYGPIVDNAGGIAQMTSQDPEVRRITDRLDAAGNTTAAIGKAFAVSATAAAALSLLTAYSKAAHIAHLDIRDPRVMAGLLIGGVLPALLSSLTLRAVGKTASRVVEEVRRQFKETPGLLEGKVEPDYARCVDIATTGALGHLVVPCLLAAGAPFIVVLALGREALAGVLAGCIVSGIFLALLMANVGCAWDNAKKFIEAGELGGKGSLPHKASVVADTVGDPLKDTAGPTLNILIELLAAVSVAFVPLFLRIFG